MNSESLEFLKHYIALINGQVDMHVQIIPTALPVGIFQAAVLKATTLDILVP
jgi:hypothetical protein